MLYSTRQSIFTLLVQNLIVIHVLCRHSFGNLIIFIKGTSTVNMNTEQPPATTSNKRKAVHVTANWVFFCVRSVHNIFVNPELINTTYSEKLGTLCTFLIYVQFICKTKTFNLQEELSLQQGFLAPFSPFQQPDISFRKPR